MKKGIHPQLFKTTVRCACGATFETMTTKEKVRVEICSQCNPFFTGKEKLVDAAGRIEKFEKKYANARVGKQKKEGIEPK